MSTFFRQSSYSKGNTTRLQLRTMQSRQAAFKIFRGLILRGCEPAPRRLPGWSSTTAHPFHDVAPRPFHHSTRYYNDQQPARSPLQETVERTHKPETSIAPERKSHAPPPPIHFEKQAYEMTFTCKPCSTRSTHKISKQGYHFGSVLIACPECKNRHIISDHLGIFTDKAGMTVEDFMHEKGQLVKKGTLSEDGDLEFWEDGTTSRRVEK